MLGTVPTEVLSVRRGVSPQLKSEENEGEVVVPAQTAPTPIEQKTETPQQQVPPTFTIPTTTTQVPVQAVIQTVIPKKNN